MSSTRNKTDKAMSNAADRNEKLKAKNNDIDFST
jgi:hypothetical protein